MKSNKPKGTSILFQQKPWDKNENSIWLASTVSLTRNIQKFKFPGKLEADRQSQMIALISKEMLACKQLAQPGLFKAEELSSLQKEYLIEHFLSQNSFHPSQANEAIVLDHTGEFLSILNMKDHIHMQLIDCKGELENTWNRLVAIESAIGKQLSYAFNSKYGFLTADFNQCGTGLNIAVFLQVPGLVHTNKIDDVLEKLADDSLNVTGIQGNPTEIIGDVLMVQNNYALGVTEENIVSNLRAFTTKMLVEENSARRKILKETDPEIKDKVSRAFGILVHSYQIDAIEALNALSLLKLGSELNWLSGLSSNQVNRLFFNCRRAHLVHHYDNNVKQEEILHKRAEFIHSHLKDVKLTI